MNRIGAIGIILLCLTISRQFAHAQDFETIRQIELSVKLREANYLDTSVQLLEELESRPELNSDQRTDVLLEKGLTYKKLAATTTNPDQQKRAYEKAIAALDSFLKLATGHPLRALALTEKARIVLAEGQTLNWQGAIEDDNTVQLQQLKQARELIETARGLFQESFQLSEAQWKTFPSFIPEDDLKQRAQRERVEGELMRAKLDLATCRYELAQTHLQEPDTRTRLLIEAATAFEQVHIEYRQQLAGLFARMMQAKCNQDRGDIRDALGIYDELLRTPPDYQKPLLMDFLAQVLHYRLMCLNDPTRADYQFVVDEATSYFNVDRKRAFTQIGMGIRWELIRALEALGNPERRIPGDDVDPEIYRRRALSEVKELARIPGRYQKLALRAESRLLESLDRQQSVPKDFSVAFASTNDLLDRIAKVQEQIEKASLDEKNTGTNSETKNQPQLLQTQLENLIKEARETALLGLSLRRPTTDVKDFHLLQYRLAYLEYLSHRDWDTLAFAEYLVRHAAGADEALRQDATYLAMASLARQFSQAQGFRRQHIISQLQELCQVAVSKWPQSYRIIDAQMTLGTLLLQAQKPLDAVRWFSGVPKTSDRYGEAQTEAGQAYWQASILEMSRPSAANNKTQIDQWQQQARSFLESGIKVLELELDRNEDMPDSLLRGKISLAQLDVFQGNDKKAIAILTQNPFSVTQAIDARLKDPSTAQAGSSLGSLVYQLLLRAYVGSKQLDDARSARLELERIVGKQGTENLARVYTQLGQQLQQELEQKEQLGETQRAQEIRTAFVEFLEDLFNSRQSLQLGGLIWISETYRSLAESTNNQNNASDLFQKAATGYQTILDQGNARPDFLPSSQKPAVQLRLLTTLSQLGDYQQAESFVKTLLDEQPNQLEIQTAAADLYASWGTATQDPTRLRRAIAGDDKQGPMWGWNQLVMRLQGLAQSPTASRDIEQAYHETIVRMLQTRLDWSRIEKETASKTRMLKKIEADLQTLVRLSPELGESPVWDQLEDIFRQVLQAQNKPVIALQKPVAKSIQLASNTLPSNPTQNASTQQTPNSSTPTPSSPDLPSQIEQTSHKTQIVVLIIVALVTLAGATAFLIASMRKPPRSKRTSKDLVSKYRR